MPTADPLQAMTALRQQVGTVVLGQDAVVTGMVLALLVRGHVLLEGVPGTAKTLLVRSVAAALDLPTGRIQFTPDLMPGDITGSVVLDESGSRFVFRQGPVFTGLLLADEINRTPPKTQAALLEAMAELQVTVDGTSHPMQDPFLVAATQNPIEFEGTYPLPEAQLDRFFMKIPIAPPSREVETNVVAAHMAGFDPSEQATIAIQAVADRASVVAARQSVAQVRIDPAVMSYCVDIASHTRTASGVRLGASPRGSIDLAKGARAWAWLTGREFVTPDDVKALALPILGHRISLRPEAELDGRTANSVVQSALASVAVPR
jgi:MoxR-like ATPase